VKFLYLWGVKIGINIKFSGVFANIPIVGLFLHSFMEGFILRERFEGALCSVYQNFGATKTISSFNTIKFKQLCIGENSTDNASSNHFWRP
jgi:hypothetical protein